MKEIMSLNSISRKLLKDLKEKAKLSSRKRINYNFHELEDGVQRMLNVFCHSSYCCPHRHLDPPKNEFFLVLEGKIGILLFNERGEVVEKVLCDGRNHYGADIPIGAWHTVVPLTEFAVCFETKTGPYIAMNDKSFAPWAPKEGEEGGPEYLRKLQSLFDEAIL